MKQEQLTSSTGYDKRRHRRFDQDLGVLCYAAVSPCLSLQCIRNFSSLGIYLDGLNENLDIGQKIFLEFNVPFRKNSKKIKAIGKVVWKTCQGKNKGPLADGIGVEFLRMHDLDRAFFNDYLQYCESLAS